METATPSPGLRWPDPSSPDHAGAIEIGPAPALSAALLLLALGIGLVRRRRHRRRES